MALFKVERKRFKKHATKPQVKIALTESGKHIYDAKKATGAMQKIPSCLYVEEKQEFRRLLFKVRKQAVIEAKAYEEPPFPSLDGAYSIP